jgi:hypothetical protein
LKALPPTRAVVSDDIITSIDLVANLPTVGSGAWSIVFGEGGIFVDVSSGTSSSSGVKGKSYLLRWQTSNDGLTSSAFVNVRFSAENEMIDNFLLNEWSNSTIFKSRDFITLDVTIAASSDLKFQTLNGIEFNINTEIEEGAVVEFNIRECVE